MKIGKGSVNPIDFGGLKIYDYTSNTDTSSSIAEIIVPPGVKHKRAYSNRSDKYYYVVSGQLQFTVDEETFDLNASDICIIKKGQRFSYQNLTVEQSRIVLLHTPSFDLQSEIFDE